MTIKCNTKAFDTESNKGRDARPWTVGRRKRETQWEEGREREPQWEGGRDGVGRRKRERRSGKEEEREEERDAVGRRKRERRSGKGEERGRERRSGKEEVRDAVGRRKRETPWEGGRERRSGKEEERDAGQTGLARWSGGPLAPAIKRRLPINRKTEHEGHRHGLRTDCGPGLPSGHHANQGPPCGHDTNQGLPCGHQSNPVVIIPTRGCPVVMIPTWWSSYQPVRMQDLSSIKAAEPSALIEKSNFELSRLP